MHFFTTVQDTTKYLSLHRERGITTGLVPTMGALHDGHLALVSLAKSDNQLVVVTIFVNPIQFNNPADLEHYPRNLEADLALLDPVLEEDDVVFAPETSEIYPEPVLTQYDFGSIAEVMEGAFRPGHFNGVGVVVNRLLRIVEPKRSYFGEKDFQQLAIIRKLVTIENLPVEIIPCETFRHSDGLAMSSRNARLPPDQRKKAPVIYQSLRFAAENVKNIPISALIREVKSRINATPGFSTEYIEIADELNLEPVNSVTSEQPLRIFAAVHVGQVRLIDNLPLITQLPS